MYFFHVLSPSSPRYGVKDEIKFDIIIFSFILINDLLIESLDSLVQFYLRNRMPEKLLMAWEVAQEFGVSNSKFLRDFADDPLLECQKLGNTRVYSRKNVLDYKKNQMKVKS